MMMIVLAGAAEEQDVRLWPTRCEEMSSDHGEFDKNYCET